MEYNVCQDNSSSLTDFWNRQAYGDGNLAQNSDREDEKDKKGAHPDIISEEEVCTGLQGWRRND